MKNDMTDSPEILSELKSLHEKLDRILDILESSEVRQKSSNQKPPKPKAPPLTQEEVDSHRAKFDSLYDQWLSGNETEVQAELEKIDADEIRRFGDANNLNVTSKMPKQKVLHLIAARFREKKQLFRSTSLPLKEAEQEFHSSASNDNSD